MLFTPFADRNFEKRSIHSNKYFELPQFFSNGPAKSKSNSSFGSDRTGNFSLLFVPKITFKFYPPLYTGYSFSHGNKSLYTNVATKCFLPETSFRTVLGGSSEKNGDLRAAGNISLLSLNNNPSFTWMSRGKVFSYAPNLTSGLPSSTAFFTSLSNLSSSVIYLINSLEHCSLKENRNFKPPLSLASNFL